MKRYQIKKDRPEQRRHIVDTKSGEILTIDILCGMLNAINDVLKPI